MFFSFLFFSFNSKNTLRLPQAELHSLIQSIWMDYATKQAIQYRIIFKIHYNLCIKIHHKASMCLCRQQGGGSSNIKSNKIKKIFFFFSSGNLFSCSFPALIPDSLENVLQMEQDF